MDRTSKTLARIGVAALGAVTFLATPAIGVISASASPATLTPISPWNGAGGSATISALNDGTNTTIHLEALLNQATSGDPSATAVRFSYCVDDGTVNHQCVATPVLIATVSSAPYATEWTVPGTIANGTVVHLIYEALSSTNTVLDSHDLLYTVDNTKSTVHVTSPSDGGSIGIWGGKFVARGTESSGNPPVAVNGTAATVDTTAHTWYAQPASPGTGTHTVEAIANTTDSDEEISASFYDQTLPSANFTVTPPSQSAGLNGGTATSGDYTVTALDQNGKPIAGLNILVNSGTGGGTITFVAGPGSTSGAGGGEKTDVNGQVKFTDTRTTAATDTITVQTDKDNNGAYDSATDEQRTVTFTAYTATPTTLTTTATPSQSTYSPTEYTASTVGETVTLDANGVPTGGTSGKPYVGVHFVDQNGNAMTNTVISNFNYEVDRLLSDGTTTGSIPATACSGTTADVVGSCKTDAFGNIYLPHSAANNTGSDTFKAWVETDGQAGETAGDTKAPNLTLNFAGATLLWDNCATSTSGSTCNSQAAINTPVTYTVHSAVGGSVRNGDTITFSTTSGIFTTTQPAGTIRDDANDAHCVSGQGGAPSGGCSLTVNSGNTGNVTVTADDSTTSISSDLVINFRSNSVDFRQADNFDAAVVRPVTTNVPQSSTYGCFTDQVNTARPGDVVIGQYLLEDVNGNPLASVAGTATLDHGYFTDVPASYNQTETENGNRQGSTDTIPWSDVTLNGTPTAGTKIGSEAGDVAAKSNGTTMQFTTDNAGVVTFAVSIGRDALFDQNGNVSASPTVTIGNQTITLAPINDEYDFCDGLSGHADNIGPGHLNDFDFPGYTFSTDALHHDGSGYYNAASTNALMFTEVNGQSTTGLIPTAQTRTFAGWTRDSFGNLTRSGGDAIEIDTTGVGEAAGGTPGNPGFATSSYLQDVRTFVVENNTPATANCADPTTPCGTAGHQDVSGSWGVHSVDYTANPGTPPPAFVTELNQPAFNCSGAGSQTCVNPIGPVTVASLDWYIQAINAANGASYSISHIPAGDAFAVGTTVTEKVTALDQHGQPLVGLNVTFFGSGPGQQNCNVSCAGSTTDQNGTASYTYAGNFQGNTQVTGVVTAQNSNNELARVVDVVGFDGTPSISAPSSRRGTGFVTISGKSRPGARVVIMDQPFGAAVHAVTTRIADANGVYSARVSISKQTKFWVVADGVVTSVKKTVNVIEAPGLSLTTTRSHVTAHITSNPRLATATVRVYLVDSAGHRHLLGSTHTGSTGTVNFTFRSARGHVYKVQVLVIGKNAVLSGYSSDRSIRSA